jgi:hypothetical protein
MLNDKTKKIYKLKKKLESIKLTRQTHDTGYKTKLTTYKKTTINYKAQSSIK